MNYDDLKVCVLGLGYVGLPLALAFGKAKVKTVGFELNSKRVEELKKGFDKNAESSKEEILASGVEFSSDPRVLKDSNFIIVCVPTPVDEKNLPDFSYLTSASKTAGQNLSSKSIVVFESTVYPGATEEVCIPVIEKYSRLKAGVDFSYGYSPERINPGDKKHVLETVVKVVSGMDDITLNKIAEVYSRVCKAGVFKAKSVKVAEAAKVIENTQRDLNIALINELSMIFHKIGIDTKDVLEAASTKWNFLNFTPGLVGGHCVGVDPYYLIYKSKSLGFDPKVMGAGRKTNDSMAKFVTHLSTEGLKEAKKKVKRAKILVMGITFKENVKDLRNSKVSEIVSQLKKLGALVYVFDPVVERNDISEKDFKADLIIYAVPHEVILKTMTLEKMKSLSAKNPVLVDVKNVFDRKTSEHIGFIYKSL